MDCSAYEAGEQCSVSLPLFPVVFRDVRAEDDHSNISEGRCSCQSN